MADLPGSLQACLSMGKVAFLAILVSGGIVMQILVSRVSSETFDSLNNVFILLGFKSHFCYLIYHVLWQACALYNNWWPMLSGIWLKFLLDPLLAFTTWRFFAAKFFLFFLFHIVFAGLAILILFLPVLWVYVFHPLNFCLYAVSFNNELFSYFDWIAWLARTRSASHLHCAPLETLFLVSSIFIGHDSHNERVRVLNCSYTTNPSSRDGWKVEIQTVEW